jgi:hypothetical protein
MEPRTKGLKRASYAKPTVSRVLLRPEEAVLSACKSGNQSGPGSVRNNCTNSLGNLCLSQSPT